MLLLPSATFRRQFQNGTNKKNGGNGFFRISLGLLGTSSKWFCDFPALRWTGLSSKDFGIKSELSVRNWLFQRRGKYRMSAFRCICDANQMFDERLLCFKRCIFVETKIFHKVTNRTHAY